MQATGDPLLGWTSGSEAAPVDYFVRQIKDMKGSIDLERLDAEDLAIYGRICGAVLARAHTRAGGASKITGYLGGTDTFDVAVADWADAYADLTERDHAALIAETATSQLNDRTPDRISHVELHTLPRWRAHRVPGCGRVAPAGLREALERLNVDAGTGLTAAEAATRLVDHGPNTLQQEAKPSVLRVALGQLVEPMTLMLVAVAVVSIVIGQGSTAAVVVALVLLNVVMGTNQELKARASVDALASLQVPLARVLRDGRLVEIPAADLVPGDIVAVEAGDIVPADGRILTSATLEAQEAALTGESVPVGKDPAALAGADIALGDRSNMLFQNTSVTRGTGTIVITATGMGTEVGRIASMLSEVSRTRSPLQLQLDDLTKKIAIVAWATLALILVVGLIRGLSFEALMLLGISMARLGHPDRHADLRAVHARHGRPAAGEGQGHRAQPQRRRDAGGHQPDQHRQDRHAHPEPDDRPGGVLRRQLVRGRRRGLLVDRGHPRGGRRPGRRPHRPGLRRPRWPATPP